MAARFEETGDDRLPWAYYLPEGIRFIREAKAPRIDLTRLAAHDREKWQALWEDIKQHNPALAALLRDPALHELRERFDGHITIAKRDLSHPDRTG